MILKGSQRGGGQNLAEHLMRLDDNEHMTLHELRGFAGTNLKQAFKETEAISRGTKCRQYLFSLSLNPPAGERVEVATFEDAISRIEDKLGLTGQPRAIVFHEKEGRRHAHCVWSRIDADTMTARPLPFFKSKLMGVARELYLEQGWEMPRGLENPAERNPTNFTLAEWQQAKRHEIDPRWLKGAVQSCWDRSDGLRAFTFALQDKGFFLARGDRRGFVVLDHQGEVYSLARMLNAKSKDVRARLGEPESLRSVEQTRVAIGQKMTPAMRRHIEDSRTQFEAHSAKLGKAKEEMTRRHREARMTLDLRQKVETEEGNKRRAERLPKGLAGLWHRLTGRYQDIRRINDAEAALARERQARERQDLIDAQLRERSALQAEFKKLRSEQARQLLALRSDIGRFLRLSRGHAPRTPERDQGRDFGLGLRLER